MNVVNPAETINYYEKFFGGVRTKFRGVSDAVLTDRSFILLNKVDKPAPSKMASGLYHIGWGGVDGPSDFAWRDREGMEWQGKLAPLGNKHYMYAYGPDKEVIEIWTGFHHHRFGHVHMFSDDVGITTKWYVENLGLKGPEQISPKPPKPPENYDGRGGFKYLWSSEVSTENEVTINIFAKPSNKTFNWWGGPSVDELEPTEGRVIDHIAFSFRDIDSVFKRMQAKGVEIVRPISINETLNIRSFFVRAPDKVLIEIIEARPIPEGIWE